jgi:hypothetical protein
VSDAPEGQTPLTDPELEEMVRAALGARASAVATEPGPWQSIYAVGVAAELRRRSFQGAQAGGAVANTLQASAAGATPAPPPFDSVIAAASGTSPPASAVPPAPKSTTSATAGASSGGGLNVVMIAAVVVVIMVLAGAAVATAVALRPSGTSNFGQESSPTNVTSTITSTSSTSSSTTRTSKTTTVSVPFNLRGFTPEELQAFEALGTAPDGLAMDGTNSVVDADTGQLVDLNSGEPVEFDQRWVFDAESSSFMTVAEQEALQEDVPSSRDLTDEESAALEQAGIVGGFAIDVETGALVNPESEQFVDPRTNEPVDFDQRWVFAPQFEAFVPIGYVEVDRRTATPAEPGARPVEGER